MTRSSARDTRRLRVLVNGLHARSGGGVTYLRNMLPRLADDGRLELHLFLHVSQYPLFFPYDERIRLHLLEFQPDFWRLMAWEQLSLPIVARVMAVDVTFSPANYGPLFAPAPVIVLRNALAVGGTDRRPSKRIYWAGLALMTLLSLITSRRAIAVSDYARHHLAIGRLRRKIAVIHHGVNPQFSAGEISSQGQESPFLLAVGDIYVQKNLHRLIAAVARVREVFPHIRLLIAGKRIDDEYFRTLERTILKHDLDGHIVFLGERSAECLVDLYRSCAAFVFPSTVETFGNPLAEAMSCGAPIASSSATAMPEIVADAAELFDPYDDGDIAAAILRILCEADRATILRKRALIRARAFSWADTARQTSDVLIAAGRDRATDPLSPMAGEIG